jgi:putative Mg2+ transporter-C (MgtC) family protein
MSPVSEIEAVVRLVLATFIGYLIGLERGFSGQPAGDRTHALVSLGSATFALISILAFPGADPSRIAAPVVTGLGFLGAGMIIRRETGGIQGLTTAAGIWTVGGIGLAIGAGLYWLGFFSSILVGLVLISEKFLKIDQKINRWREKKGQQD